MTSGVGDSDSEGLGDGLGEGLGEALLFAASRLELPATARSCRPQRLFAFRPGGAGVRGSFGECSLAAASSRATLLGGCADPSASA